MFYSCQKETVDPAPEADFYVQKMAQMNDSVVAYFYDDSYNAVSWQWNFNNGLTSVFKNDSSKFAVGQTYLIQLKVFNESGLESEKQKSITF